VGNRGSREGLRSGRCRRGDGGHSDPESGRNLLGERVRIVAALPADMHYGDAGAGEDVVYEGVGLAAIGAIVGAVVEFDHQARREAGRISQHEVETLGLDAPPVGFVTMRRLLHLNQVCEADLDEKEGA
jgi:hypothetical protein